MAKTNQTHIIESLIFEKYFLKEGYRCALEVNIPVRGYGRCDFLGYNKSNKFVVVEIKVSLSDFKSKNGHNFVLDSRFKNYYAIPKDLVEKVKPLVGDSIGIISVDVRASDRGDYIIQSIDIVKNAAYKKDTLLSSTQLSRLKERVLTASNSNTRLLLSKLYIKPEYERLKCKMAEEYLTSQHSAEQHNITK